MAEPKNESEGSRPSTESVAIRAGSESAGVITELVERLGLSTVLLLGAVYFGYQSIIRPIADSYRQMIVDVAATNKFLQEEIRNNDEEDMERVRIITAQIERLEDKIDKMLELELKK
jgi:low affinity Fe/Cu permease